MLTAREIAEKTDLPVWTVRYRLDLLRTEGQVNAEQFGTTYVYPESVIEKVTKWEE